MHTFCPSDDVCSTFTACNALASTPCSSKLWRCRFPRWNASSVLLKSLWVPETPARDQKFWVMLQNWPVSLWPHRKFKQFNTWHNWRHSIIFQQQFRRHFDVVSLGLPCEKRQITLSWPERVLCQPICGLPQAIWFTYCFVDNFFQRICPVFFHFALRLPGLWI